MIPNRIVGVVLLVVAVALLIVGINSSNSVADQVNNTLSGRYTQTTTVYIVGGLAAGVLGLLLVVADLRRKYT